MSIWVLLLVLTASTGTSSEQIVLDSKEACEQVMLELKKSSMVRSAWCIDTSLGEVSQPTSQVR